MRSRRKIRDDLEDGFLFALVVAESSAFFLGFVGFLKTWFIFKLKGPSKSRWVCTIGEFGGDFVGLGNCDFASIPE